MKVKIYNTNTIKQDEEGFLYLDLSGANLTGANLPWANLSGANLRGANAGYIIAKGDKDVRH